MPLDVIALIAASDARNVISFLAAATSVEPATTAAAKTVTY